LSMRNFTSMLESWATNAKKKLIPLPGSLYTSPEFLALEIEQLFYRKWVNVGHVSEWLKYGDYRTIDIVDKPLLVVRDQSDKIKAFSNVCRHRGAILASGNGNARAFTCPYHAWTYDVSGNLLAAPFIEKDRISDICLPEYKVETWQGLVFVSLDDHAEPLSPTLARLEERIAAYNLASYVVIQRKEIEFACNWKILVENFCESYHLFAVHKNTLEPYSPTKTTQVLEGGDAFNHHTMLRSSNKVTEEELNRLPGKLAELGNLICIYPCLAFSINSTTALWLSIQPAGPDKLRATMQIALLPDAGNNVTEEFATSVRESTAEFMAEDKNIVELVQRGLAANVGNCGVMHEWEKTNWEFGQFLVRTLLSSNVSKGRGRGKVPE